MTAEPEWCAPDQPGHPTAGDDPVERLAALLAGQHIVPFTLSLGERVALAADLSTCVCPSDEHNNRSHDLVADLADVVDALPLLLERLDAAEALADPYAPPTDPVAYARWAVEADDDRLQRAAALLSGQHINPPTLSLGERVALAADLSTCSCPIDVHNNAMHDLIADLAEVVDVLPVLYARLATAGDSTLDGAQ